VGSRRRVHVWSCSRDGEKGILDADDELIVYYGAADSVICAASARIGDLIPERFRWTIAPTQSCLDRDGVPCPSYVMNYVQSIRSCSIILSGASMRQVPLLKAASTDRCLSRLDTGLSHRAQNLQR